MTDIENPTVSPSRMAVDGVLVVNKPAGPSSHDVVIVARRSLGVSRIGHTGTLDPLATGVLPLVVGQATRLARLVTASDKEYEATLRFGAVSDTYDAAGDVVERPGGLPDRQQLEAALERFRGRFEQAPPAYSAKMIGGERAYARARAGRSVPSATVSVRVYRLELIEYAPPLARLRIRCSAGFYVRSLAHDLGHALGVGGILQALVRTEAGGFPISAAVPFEQLVTAPRAELRGLIRPMETLLTELPAAVVTDEGVDWTRHGRDLGPRQLRAPRLEPAPVVRLLAPDGRLIGLADGAKKPGFLHPVVVFSYN